MLHHLKRFFHLAILVNLLLGGCVLSLPEIPGLTGTEVPSTQTGPTPTPTPAVAITFDVTLPSPLLPDETLYLSVVDEVTGLGLNPVNHIMQSIDLLHYNLTVPFPLGSIIKYRYIRQSTLPIQEDDSADRIIRYRIYHATAPGNVQDIISSWTDGLFNGSTGRITGTVVDAADGKPLTNIMVAVGGQQTLTDSQGEFIVEGLPVGTLNLVAYALDGWYQTFQQGAVVMADKTTPARIPMKAANPVNVIFTVSVPEDTVPNTPIRLAGNLITLGNTYGDLEGGLSTIATWMPNLNPLGDGRFSLSVMLPAGADLRYKYTLGDGFWNAEHSPYGDFTIRQLVIPSDGEVVQVMDSVSTWQDGGYSPIQFDVTVPGETPVSDIISIQFNPYGWTVPIPMWPMGENRWRYILYSPLNILSSFEYRYCRNDQCGLADDVQTSPGHAGRPITSSFTSQQLQDAVSDWIWLENDPISLLTEPPVISRTDGFWAGIEFLPAGKPAWRAWLPQAVLDVQALHANWLVVTPTWSVQRSSPYVFTPVPGIDPLFSDTLHLIAGAHTLSLKSAIFPLPNLPLEWDDWWKTMPLDSNWWEAWYDSYMSFVLYHADLATQSGAEALILGGEWVLPALPGDRTDSAGIVPPTNASIHWEDILEEVRTHYNGEILWAVQFPEGLETTPPFMDKVDGIYLMWDYLPGTSSTSSVDEMEYIAGTLLDTLVQPYQSLLGKPVIIASAYPSAEGAASGAIPMSWILAPGSTFSPVNLQVQVDFYRALLEAINERDWVSGFVSRGYYPPAVLHDASASIHGKPAADLLAYWYKGFLGIFP